MVQLKKSFFYKVLALALLVPTASHAGLTTSATANSVSESTNANGAGPVQATAQNSAGLISSTATARADYGVLKTYASGMAGATNEYAGVTASSGASASWFDTIKFENAALNGTLGRVTFALAYNYALMAETNFAEEIPHPYTYARARSGFDLMLNVYSYNGYNKTYSARAVQNSGADRWGSHPGTPYSVVTDVNGSNSSTPGLFFLTADFIWGTTITLTANMATWGDIGVSHSASGSYKSDAFHSAYWGGVSSVLSNGQQVMDFTITSDSGTDYMQSFIPAESEVPEPTSLALLGIGALALMRRRACK